MRLSIPRGPRGLLLATLPLGLLPAATRADTICVEEMPLAPTGGSGVDFGRAVAVDGDLAVVCADLEAYAFHWTGAAWVQEAVLTIPGAESGFGHSAALDGDTVLIGLPRQDGAFVDSGRVLVFVRDGGGSWSLEDELLPTDPGLEDFFGTGVALEGDRALVGASGDDSTVPNTGAVYAFERSGTTWSQTAKIPAPDDETIRFGSHVELSGDTALVSTLDIVGGALVYALVGGGWTPEAQLGTAIFTPWNIALDGDRAVVASYFDARVYERTGSTWTETALLDAPASSAALDGDVLVLGGPSCPTVPAARVFVYDGGGLWEESAQLQIAGSEIPADVSGLRVVLGTRGGLACLGGVASTFELALHTPPSVATRNAGTNPSSYTAVSASYGGTLEFTIDLTTTGHGMGLVIGFDSPFGVTLGGGQTLLCLDLGNNGELINTGFHPGPIVNLSLNLPNDPSLEGGTVYTQAVHAFGIKPFALSNAQDITIGGCP